MIRPMRGQVILREERTEGLLWTPTPGPRAESTHTGRVLALGPPARTEGGAEVPHEYQVGDLVEYFWTHLEEKHTHEWEGQKAVWIPQSNISGVWFDDTPHAGIEE